MKKWYFFDSEGNEMDSLNEDENFNSCTYVYVNEENIEDFRAHFYNMGYGAQETVTPDELCVWDVGIYEFKPTEDQAMIKKIADFLEKENTVKKECVAENSVELPKSNQLSKNANLILILKDGTKFQTNTEPCDISEFLEAIPTLLKPSILGNQIHSIIIERTAD
jgi:hypothetical protein